MPLFASTKDAGFLKGINRELLHKIISVEVGVYKISLDHTKVDIYEESNNKIYKDPVRIFSIIAQQPKESADDDHGVNFVRTITFGFIKGDLRDKDLYLETGDIVEYDDSYYEVDLVRTSNYWAGRNPNTLMVNQEGGAHGYDHSILCDAHLTRINNITTVNIRTGINIDNNGSSIPKNIYGE